MRSGCDPTIESWLIWKSTQKWTKPMKACTFFVAFNIVWRMGMYGRVPLSARITRLTKLDIALICLLHTYSQIVDIVPTRAGSARCTAMNWFGAWARITRLFYDDDDVHKAECILSFRCEFNGSRSALREASVARAEYLVYNNHHTDVM